MCARTAFVAIIAVSPPAAGPYRDARRIKMPANFGASSVQYVSEMSLSIDGPLRGRAIGGVIISWLDVMLALAVGKN